MIPTYSAYKMTFLRNTLYFFRKHFAVIIAVGLIASFGRVIQLGGFGKISSTTNVVLEIFVETARLSLFLYVLGMANIKNGILQIRNFVTNRESRKSQWQTGIRNIKHHWALILLNIVGFAFIIWALNFLIDVLAYQTCLYLTLKKDGILAPSSSEWTILLFFKNLSVIPFTIVFETLLLLWITKRPSRFRPAMDF